MKTYKNIEIYKTAFNLAISVYRMNVMLPGEEMKRHGNKLRRLTIQVRDFISDGYIMSKNSEELSQFLMQAKTACDNTILLLNKIKKSHTKDRSLSYLIMEYIKLKNAIHKVIVSNNKNSEILSIPYPESKVLEPEI